MKHLLIVLPAIALASGALAETQRQPVEPPQVDYAGFAQLTGEVAALRDERLLAKEEFFKRASAKGALLLDTRS
ncbi:MAG: hypothetical protein AAGK01_08780, partial [Pseudomonadota bacterium]